MKRLHAATLAVSATLLLAGCSAAAEAEPSPTPTSDEFSARGSVSTRPSLSYFAPGDEEGHEMGDECVSADNYDYIAEGAQVVITDDAGKTVGVGELSAGVLGSGAGTVATSMLDAECKFTFRTTVDSDSKFFGVAVGNDARGVTQVSAKDLRWDAILTLVD